MKILFVHEVNYLHKVLFEMHEFPELLSLRGHEVTFLHYPEHDPSQDGGRPSLRSRRHPVQGRAYEDASLDLVTPPTFGGRPYERLLAPVTNVPIIHSLLRSGRFDVVVVYSVPTTGWQTITLARRCGVPTVFRAIDVSHSLRRTRFGGLIKAAEGHVYRHADLISANNPALAAYCVEHGSDPARTRVDLPPLDVAHLSPGPPPPGLRERYGIRPGDRVMLFMGTLYRFAGLEQALATAAPALRDDPRMKFVLVGDGEMSATLFQLSERLGVTSQVVMTGRVPYSTLPDHIRLGDVAVNPFEKQLTTDCALPHKVLQYMASGVATVSTSLDGLRGIVGNTSGVQLVNGPEEVADHAVALLHDDNARHERSRRQRAFIEDTFQLDKVVERFEDALHAARAERP